LSTERSTTRPFAGRALAAAMILAGGLFAAAPKAEAAPLTPSPAVAGEAEAGVVPVQYGYYGHRRHHHHWGHHRRWHHHHRGWGHRHHGWRHHHHHRGWGHRHHHRW